MRILKFTLLTAPALVVLSLCLTTQAQTWTQDGPAARFHTSGIYDASTDQLVVFGGQQASNIPLGDVWSSTSIVAAGQTGTTTPYHWAQVFPTGTAPAARFGHGAAYDSLSNRMIVFGGATSNTGCMNDLWVLDGANSANGSPAWIPLAASGPLPPARVNFNTAYDPSTNTLIVFGGSNCSAGFLSDVWVLSNANGEIGTPTWTQLSPSGVGPSARENASTIYDSVNNVLTVFGGDSGSTGLNDVWTLSNANGQGGTPVWTHLSPTGTAPSARTGQSAIYDSANNRMVMYGGINSLTSVTYLGDTWILTFPNGIGGTPAWISEKVTGTAPQLRFHVAFFNAPNNDMVVFGGESQIVPSAPNDRVFILSKANGL
jgi:galactose oxidase-like protein